MEADDGSPPGDDGTVACSVMCVKVRQPVRCLVVDAVFLCAWTVLDVLVLTSLHAEESVFVACVL